MLVHVELHFLPKYCGGQKNVKLELSEDAELSAVLQALGIPEGETGVILMDKKHAALSDKLLDGAHLDIYPIITGG